MSRSWSSRLLWSAIALFAIVLSTSCAPSTERIAAKASDPDEARIGLWENVERLETDTAVRVTRRDGERFYGRVMSVSNLRITLALTDRSQSIPRSEVLVIERFPIHFQSAVPKAAVGVGAALSLSSSSAPKNYSRSVAPAHEAMELPSRYRDGYYVDALELAGTAIQMTAEALERARQTRIVYRSR
jgi:hypothetical protein